MATIAITGITGTVGRQVAELFEAEGRQLIALARTPSNAGEWGCVVLRRFDYDDPTSYDTAFNGVDKLLVIANKADGGILQSLQRAKELGVAHVVVLSGVSAEKTPLMPLAQVEKVLYQTHVPFTCLRLNWFMQNFSGLFANEIRDEELLALPAGDAKTSFVDTRDIAEVVATILKCEDDFYFNKAFPITGSTPFDHYAVAEMIATASGREVHYRPLNDEEGYLKFCDMGFDQDSAAIMVQLYRGVRNGITEITSPWVENILGRPPRSFASFVQEFKKVWTSEHTEVNSKV